MPNNNKSVRDQLNNRYGSMNNDELVKFIVDTIAERKQDQPAASLLDSLGYQHNDRTAFACSQHNITYIPSNITKAM